MKLKQILHFGGHNKERLFSSLTVPGWSQCSMPQKSLNNFFKESTEELAFFLAELQLHTDWPLIFAAVFH